MSARLGRTWTRLVSMSRTGRFVALRARDTIDLVDALGTAPRQSLAAAGVIDFACVGTMVWLLEPRRLRRFLLDGARPLEPSLALDADADALAASIGENAHTALVLGARPALANGLYDRVSAEPFDLGDDERAFPLHGRRVLLAGKSALRFVEVGRGEAGRAMLTDAGEIRAAGALFAGRAVAMLTRDEHNDLFWVLRPNGSLIHKVIVPRADRWALAENRGVALVASAEGNLVVVDLRYGRVQSEAAPPWPVHDLDVDSDGQYVVLAGEPDASGTPVLHVPSTDLFSAAASARRAQLHAVAEARPRTASSPALALVRDEHGGNGASARRLPGEDEPDAPDAPEPEDEVERDDGDAAAAADDDRDRHLAGDRDPAEAPPTRPSPPPLRPAPRLAEPVAPAGGHVLTVTTVPPGVDAASLDEAPPPEPEDVPPPPVVVVPDIAPVALGQPLPPITAEPHPEWPPYTSAREHLDEMLDLVAARAAKAIAEAWNSGRLSVPAEDGRPFEREVRALLGHVGGYAPDLLGEADERLARTGARTAGRARSSIARGMRLPFVELSREFHLSSVAAHVLMVAMAPSIRGEIARLFGILGNDENRPIVDRYLVETVIGGGERQARAEVARELADDAPLVRYGLLRVGGGDRGAPLFGPISVDPVLIERVRGRSAAGAIGDVTVVRHAARPLEQLHISAQVKRDLILALAAPRRDDDPIRVVLRGRRGAGRHSLMAALAARVGRGIAAIDCHRLPRAGKLMAAALRQELFRALLRGCVPVVSGLEAADPADAEGQDLIKQTLRAHPGPAVIRAAPEASLPLDPGYVTATLPPLNESERTAFWTEALERAGLPVKDVDALAARYRIGPGVIEQVIAQVVSRRNHEGAAPDDDAGAQLDEVAGQHIATRLSHIATHVRRLAKWEQVALPDDIIDSIREFVARISHRKTVYERWGFDAKMSTSRGLTALFYGPPGTGKSMVAGLIARELGLELYRIDLARIVSKWIGETEKNLAEVFDAAEDGQVVILFDEADSLFAKRTEVKSSVDRYANLEVNYLLQRLDTFEGVGILTTNLEGSIDQAFKRRMSLRLHFPFPDEDMRVRLWAAHIPAEVPVQGDFDFLDLARRFPLSGGYIRNSTLRAAFLAAQENRALGQEHLLRAIALEYRELGKLSTSGRME
ncbi:MAG: ATP-binding protein [Kofleriaceae bacterium]|nr:ATP-binding protein [Kofleriaceae bacterium]